MINVVQAKRLKHCGFPQEGYITVTNDEIRDNGTPAGELVLVRYAAPSEKELIEWLRERKYLVMFDFDRMVLIHDGVPHWNKHFVNTDITETLVSAVEYVIVSKKEK